MKEFINQITKHMIIESVIAIIMGIALLIWPQTSTKTIVYLLAAYFVVMGVINIITYIRTKDSMGGIVAGIFEIIIAILMFIFPAPVASIVIIILAALIILMSIVNIVRAIEMGKLGIKSWVTVLVINLVMLVAGIIIIFNPFSSVLVLMRVLGVVLIAKGIIDLVSYAYFAYNVKNN